MEQNDDRVPHRLSLGNDRAPLARSPQVEAIGETVEREQPGEGEVERHPPGKAAFEAEFLVDGVGEQVEPVPTEQADAVGVSNVGPVDPQPTPDHDGEQREVDPVHPAPGSGVEEDGSSLRRGRRLLVCGNRGRHRSSEGSVFPERPAKSAMQSRVLCLFTTPTHTARGRGTAKRTNCLDCDLRCASASWLWRLTCQ